MVESVEGNSTKDDNSHEVEIIRCTLCTDGKTEDGRICGWCKGTTISPTTRAMVLYNSARNKPGPYTRINPSGMR